MTSRAQVVNFAWQPSWPVHSSSTAFATSSEYGSTARPADFEPRL